MIRYLHMQLVDVAECVYMLLTDVCLLLRFTVGIVYIYYFFYQQVDAESDGSTWELTKEGMLFLLFSRLISTE